LAGLTAIRWSSSDAYTGVEPAFELKVFWTSPVGVGALWSDGQAVDLGVLGFMAHHAVA